MRNQIITGNALSVLKTLPDNSVDSIVQDPPCGIAFMGKEWDKDKGGRMAWVTWLSEIMTEAARVLKPGGHALVWALPRTSHWTACALEDAGFEIRDKLYHIFASGFPKSLDISKAIDRLAGAEREVISTHKTKDIRRNVAEDIENGWTTRQGKLGTGAPTQYMEYAVTAPTTQEAKKWAGYGTALKPAVEEWILCRKPLSETSVASNVLTWETGGLNIASCRVGSEQRINPGMSSLGVMHDDNWQPKEVATLAIGRYPSHFLLSHAEDCEPGACVPSCPALELDEQSGIRKSGTLAADPGSSSTKNAYGDFGQRSLTTYGDEGGASRYFAQFYPYLYAPKASTAERNLGCETPNMHPTVKNQQLMRWLCKLITPPCGVVLDCFAGSGSTGVAAIAEGFKFIGIELDPVSAKTAQERLNYAIAEAEAEAKRAKQIVLFEVPVVKKAVMPKPAIRELWEVM